MWLSAFYSKSMNVCGGTRRALIIFWFVGAMTWTRLVGGNDDNCLYKPFKCVNGTQRIKLNEVCDGTVHCSDSSDEGEMCSIDCNSTYCEHTKSCHQTPTGPNCFCPKGFYPHETNSTVCVDYDECRECEYSWPPICAQTCNNTAPGYTCTCVTGYQMNEEREHKICRATSQSVTYILYVVSSSIMRLELSHGRQTYPQQHVLRRTKGYVESLGPSHSIAMDVLNGKVYFFDAYDSIIKRIDISGENVQNVITNGLFKVSAFAVDWLGRNLYISDIVLKKIFACSLKNGLCTDLHVPDVHEPLSLAVDSSRRMLYWGDCGKLHQKIVATHLDGSKSKVLVTEDVMCASSLFVDLPSNTLFWADRDLEKIMSHSLDLDDALPQLMAEDIAGLRGVVVFEEELIWTSSLTRVYADGVIRAANKYKCCHQYSGLTESTVIPESLHLYHPVLQMREDNNACEHQHCSDICLLTVDDGYICACPIGKKLDKDQHLCIEVWEEPSLIVVHKSYLMHVLPQAVGAKTFEHLLSNGNNITALAVDSFSLTVFFADISEPTQDRVVGSASISSFHIANSEQIRTLHKDVGHVTGLAVDWISRNLFWIDQTKRTIEMSRLDGKSRIVLIGGYNENDLELPTALAIDPVQSRLYYSDCGKSPHISFCSLSGSGCPTIVELLQTTDYRQTSYCASTLFIDHKQQRLYWTNPVLGNIQATSLHPDELFIVDILNTQLPMSAVIDQRNIYYTDYHEGDIMVKRLSGKEEGQRYKIVIGTRPLSHIVSTDKELQPHSENACSKENGGCSDICLASSDTRSTCVCPSYSQLGPDGKTCVHDNEADKLQQSAYTTTEHTSSVVIPSSGAPEVDLRTDQSGAYSSTQASNSCPQKTCLNGGLCVMESSDRNSFYCKCAAYYTGALCESTLTPATTWSIFSNSLTADVPFSHVWAVIVIVVAAFVGVLTGVFVYCLAKNGAYDVRYKMRSLLTSVIGRLKRGTKNRRGVDDDDAHTSALVKSSYDNPGYIDVGGEDYELADEYELADDDFENQKGTGRSKRLILVAPSSESLDSAYISRTEF